MTGRWRIAASLAAMHGLAGPAAAQDAGASRMALNAEPGARLSLAPYVWMPSLRGDIGASLIRTSLDVTFVDVVEGTDEIVAAMGTIDYGTPSWGVFFDTRQVGLSDSSSEGTSMGSAVELNVDFAVGVYEFGGRWRVGEAPAPAPGLMTPGVHVLVGARVTSVDLELGLGRLTLVDESEVWVEPFVGAALNSTLGEGLGLRLRGDVGGFGIGSNVSLQGQAALTWEPGWFDGSTVVYLGYRALYQDYESASFEWDMLLHGPMLGVGIRF